MIADTGPHVKIAIPEQFRRTLDGRLPATDDVAWYHGLDDVAAAARDAEVLVIGFIDGGEIRFAIESATSARWISTHAAGVDHYPIDLLTQRGLTLTNGAGVNAPPIAEYVVLCVLSAAKSFPFFVAAGEGFELHAAVQPITDGTELSFGGSSIRVIATPGHTPGSTSYLVNGRWLLSGDTLFVNGIGRPDLGGLVEAWGRSLFRTLHHGPLGMLPAGTMVLPAHFASPGELDGDGVVQRRLGDIRAASPELALSTEEAFVEAMRRSVKPPPEVYQKIVAANLSPGMVRDEQASEWELGKNQCAVSMPSGPRG